MHDQIVALVPALVRLSMGLGFGALTALALSAGAAVVGAAFGPTNPFQSDIALRFAQLPPLSQPGLRFGLLVAAVAVWIGWTLAMASRDDPPPADAAPTPAPAPATGRDFLLLAIVLVPFVPYVYGVLRFDWGFDELSGLFLLAVFAMGLVSGRTLSETAVELLRVWRECCQRRCSSASRAASAWH